jgi:hypothetical protein
LEDGYWVAPISAEAAADSTLSLLLPVAVLSSSECELLMLPVFTTQADAKALELAVPPQYFPLALLAALVPPGTALAINFGTENQVDVDYASWSQDDRHHATEVTGALGHTERNWLQRLADGERKRME